MHMGWSVAEDLLCVAEDGTVSVYDIHGVYKRTFSMGQVCGNLVTFSVFIIYSYS